MTEKDFWTKLMFRLSAELSAMPGRRAFRYWWCDGFVPLEYDLPNAQIRGSVWVVTDRAHEKWAFTLHLGRAATDAAQIDWAKLFPAEDKEGWIDLDLERHSMTLEL